eukprot:CAMPEP_0168591086 /NCGR_PEP_ID=MMETSP0420-20121227/6936_1 /TAXON_ID=498008 /ORGANISM="Pessonella sp." /LENGTH=339 /DNA_ID=CAMNT_0008626833 /DNA_START=131 /DNA_END=1150 /DNA_ORIENTATION=+
MASGIKDRERALEEAAARKHDAKLLADLAEKLKIQKGEKAQDSGKSISVVGAGLMGSGIAQVAAQQGFNVTLIDVNASSLGDAKKRIGDSIGRVAKKKFANDNNGASKWKDEVVSRISTTDDVSEGVKNANFVIEAIVENLKTKWELFSQVEKAAPSDAIFASNTSSLKIDDIASSSGDPSRIGGMHFFNPVPVMKLVEIVSGQHTSAETTRALSNLGEQLGKTVVQAKDTPGFIVNRLLVPYMAEAMRLLERGDASLSDIDLAMKLGASHPMGPLELADYVGLDTCKFIMDGWSEAYPNELLFKTPDILNTLVNAGHLGNKSGSGFYVKGKPNPILNK